MEQGLEVPAGSSRDASVECDGRRKDEGARGAVNGRPAMVAPVTRTREAEFLRSPWLSAVGKLRRAAGASRGGPFRDGLKRGEPQDRQRPATRPQGRGGANRRGGEKPRGRNADGNRHSHPEGKTNGAVTLRSVPRETDSTASNDGGAIFGQPQERKPGFAAGPQGPERVGGRRQGQEGRAHLTFVTRRGPVDGPRRPARRRKARCQGHGGRR